MTAALALVPTIRAVAEPAPSSRPGLLAKTASAVGQVDPTRRKGPHSLRLIHTPASPARPRLLASEQKQDQPRPEPPPELAFYRRDTELLLRRYTRLSRESGRVPSRLTGAEIVRGKVSSCRLQTFEDAIIFTHDVRRCLQQLGLTEQHLLWRIAMQQYREQEVAAMLGLSLRSVVRRYRDALDALTALLLERRLMTPLGERKA